jgi:hypothetical protein
MASADSSQPLLNSNQARDLNGQASPYQDQSETFQHRTSRYVKIYNSCRQEIKTFLSSRAQHYTVLALVSFDLLGIFADILINLYQCDEGDTSPRWNEVRDSLGIAGLVFSCLFMLELILSVWAFGWR